MAATVFIFLFTLLPLAGRNTVSSTGTISSDRIRLSLDTNMTLFGSASVKNGAISLTDPAEHPTAGAAAGRALYSHPMRFLEPGTRSMASFSSIFTFFISASPSFGDGLAFIITSSPSLPPSAASAGHLGLFPFPSGEDSSTFAVEFDTSLDLPLHDINSNHVAVDVGSILSVASTDAANAGIDLKAGVPITAWVSYHSAEKLLRVWLSYSKIRPANPLLAANVDIAPLFRDSMYVGFAASNGDTGQALHFISKWSFHTFGFSSSVYSGGPNDAVIIEPLERPRMPWRRLKIEILISGIIVTSLLTILLALLVFRCVLRRSRKEDNVGGGWRDGEVVEEPLPARMSLDQIKIATNCFHENKVVAAGRSSIVYEGHLPLGNRVAVKRFNHFGQFIITIAAEFTTVGWYRHKNLVPLKAWCCERNELLLVYEFMPNGSLDKLLHSPSAAAVVTWDHRLNILLGIGSAVSFLHEECDRTIVHRDIKTSKILLDADFTAKLGDFSLSWLRQRSRTRPHPVLSAGTMGYLAPEYVHSGLPTEKSDVYSFGIVVLEVATGRRPMDKGIVLLDWVWELWRRRKLVNAADPRLGGGFSSEDMVRVLSVGLWCAHPDSKQRPSIRKAMRMILGASLLPILPAKKPAVRLVSQLPEASSSQDNTAGHTTQVSEDVCWVTPDVSFGQAVAETSES